MPTIAYDFTDAGDFADFVTLEPGNYVFKFKAADGSQTSKSGGKKVVVDLIVTAAENSHAWAIGGQVRRHWPTTGQASGRFRSFLAALGVTAKEKGSLKLEKYYGTEIGARVTKTAGDRPDAEGNVQWFNELQSMMPGDQMRKMIGAGEADEEDEEEEVEEEEVEEEEEEESEDSDEEEESDDDEEEEEEEEEGEELTFDDVKKMSLTELKALAKEYDISTNPPKGKKLTSAVMVKRLEALFEEAEEEDEEDPF